MTIAKRSGHSSTMRPKLFPAARASVMIAAILELYGCGGGDSTGTPAADFSVSLSASSLSAPVGASTPSLVIAIKGLNGFSGPVSVVLKDAPNGVRVVPSSAFSLAAGASKSVSFDLADSVAVGPTTITITAASGSHSHSTQVELTAESIVRTYQMGSRLYLASGNSTDTARVGLETTWGGSIVELSVNGTEYVNRHDTGREVQPAFRSPWNLNWNPTLAGDGNDRGTALIDQVVDADSIYIKAKPLQWIPGAFGGGPGQPIAGDMLVEQTVTAVKSSPHTFKVHYKVTHLGTDYHGTGGQEFLAVYTNRDYATFVSYAGPKPWSNDNPSVMQFPLLGSPNPPVTVTERWGALVDKHNMGLTVYAPASGAVYIGFVASDPALPGGPDDNSTNYFAALPDWTIAPGLVKEADFYLIGGDYHAARSIVYRLHDSLPPEDVSAPVETLDQPSAGETIGGVVPVSGWAFDDTEVSKVEILMDGALQGIATYGQPRPDVATAYPNLAPVNVGFSYSLATAKFPNGPHALNVRATDTSGNVALLPDVIVTVAN
jgi:Bacterial Ig domain